jgi:maltose-binding protein MalE
MRRRARQRAAGDAANGLPTARSGRLTAVQGVWATLRTTSYPLAAADHRTYRELLERNPLAQAFLDTIPLARPLPGVVGLPAVIQVVSEMVESAVLGGIGPEEALATASARIDAELRRAQKA